MAHLEWNGVRVGDRKWLSEGVGGLEKASNGRKFVQQETECLEHAPSSFCLRPPALSNPAEGHASGTKPWFGVLRIYIPCSTPHLIPVFEHIQTKRESGLVTLAASSGAPKPESQPYSAGDAEFY